MIKLYDSHWDSLPVDVRSKILLHKSTHPAKEEELIEAEANVVSYDLAELWQSFSDKYAGCISGTSVLIEELFYQYVISVIVCDLDLRKTVHDYVKRSFESVTVNVPDDLPELVRQFVDAVGKSGVNFYREE